MAKKYYGDFSFSVEEGTDDDHAWFGTINFPEDTSSNIRFELHSNNKPYSRSPFSAIGDHDGTTVRGWINANRPITLIEPYTNYIGGGAWARGYRMSATIKGASQDCIEEEHFIGGDEGEISEVGFYSEYLTELCSTQAPLEGAKKSINYPHESTVINKNVSLKGAGDLVLHIAFKKDEEGEEVFARSFIRLYNEDLISVWKVTEFARFQLAMMDFLSGKPEGEFKLSVLGRREQDSSLRISSGKRGELRGFRDGRAKINDPISKLPELFYETWHNESVKERVFASTFFNSAELGLIERFSRISAYLEKHFRKRYGKEAELIRQVEYKKGIRRYSEFIKSGGTEIVEFSKKFARPSYPKNSTLRELFELALAECRPLGLAPGEDYHREIVDLRNEVFHGHEGDTKEWIKRIQKASEVSVAVLELLTAKDMGLEPPKEYQPRHDVLGTQMGIYDQT